MCSKIPLEFQVTLAPLILANGPQYLFWWEEDFLNGALHDDSRGAGTGTGAATGAATVTAAQIVWFQHLDCISF